jgi:hypothetical protein
MSSDEKSLLLRVATACSIHQSFHKGRPEEEDIPEECHKAQLLLQKALLIAEVEYGASANPHPLDVLNLCNFYRSVLSAVFCPHAPELYQWGKHGTMSKFS